METISSPRAVLAGPPSADEDADQVRGSSGPGAGGMAQGSSAKTVGGPVRATRREWLGLFAIALPCLVYAMDLTVLNLAVPALSADLHPSSAQLLWIVDIYGFLVAGLLVTMGSVGDHLGHRRLLMTGAAVFAGASILTALAPSAGVLIAFRAILGIAGATLGPATLSLIRTMFSDERQRTVAIGVWISSFSLGAAVGPLVGGALLDHFWWGSVFLPSVPVMALVLIVGPRLLPEQRNPDSRHLDLASAGQSIAAVLALVYGLKSFAQNGLSGSVAAIVVAGAAMAVAFVRRQRRNDEPLLDLGLFRVPAFSAALSSYTLAFFINFGALLLLSQYLQAVLGLTPLRAGIALVPGALAMVTGSMLTPRITRHIPPPAALVGGLIVAAAGFAVFTQLQPHAGSLAVLITGHVVFSMGLAPVLTLATDLIVGSAPPERAGAAAAIAETGAELGGALGIAVLGTITTAIYRADVSAHLPAHLSHAAAEATRSTIGDAVAAHGGLHDPTATALVDTARTAFTHGFHTVALISATVAVAAAATNIIVRRHVHPEPESPHTAGRFTGGSKRGVN